MSGYIDEAKQKLPMPALLHQLGLGDRARSSSHCPLPGHEDNDPSFGIFKTRAGTWRFKCFACNSGGDEIEFLRQYEGLSNGDAIKRYKELAGVNGSRPPLGQGFGKAKAIMSKSAGTWADAKTATLPVRQESPFDWQKCVDAFTAEHQERLCDWRGFSPAFVSWLCKEKLIGLYEGLFAFPVHKGGRIVGAHYRLKSGDWKYAPIGIKAAPFVFGKLVPGERVEVCESTWDGLDYLDKSGERDGVIIARGASNAKLAAALIPEGATCYVWTQNDKAGADFEAALLANTKCAAKRVKIPAPHHDLNDWTRSGASVRDLMDAMANAETLREPEKSWDDALSESAVNSSELRNLKLTPRKKLLGDWFCEGDCGFLFAPRGVGKTFLALAIAKRISEGCGKLGEWEAHEAAKVLYLDSEMPADLMRDRSVGLKTNDNLQILNHEILFERSGKVLNIADPEIQNAITKLCINSGKKVLFIDNLSTAAKGVKENEADDWEKLSPWLLDLRRRKIAVVIVHHAGRSGEMRGTSKREDAVFWIIALDDMKKNADDKRGARFISHFTKPSRNTQEEVPAYEWHFVTEANGSVSISHKQAQTLDVFLQIVRDGCELVYRPLQFQKRSQLFLSAHDETAFHRDARQQRTQFTINQPKNPRSLRTITITTINTKRWITVLAVRNASPNCRSCTTLMGVASFCTSRSRNLSPFRQLSNRLRSRVT